MEIKLRTTTHGDFNQQRGQNWDGRPCLLQIDDRIFAAATHNAAHPPDMIRMVNSTPEQQALVAEIFARTRRTPTQNDIVGHTGHFCVWVREATTGGSDSYRRNMLAAVEEAFRLGNALGMGEIARLFNSDSEEDEEVTQDRFNEMMGLWLREQNGLPLPSWAEAEFNEAIQSGITDGTNPNGIMTRWQGALMALRAVQNNQLAR
jgi:hypothetical protein